MDRKIRQAQVNLRAWEGELFKGDATGQLGAKLDRIRSIADELEGEGWLAGQLARGDAELAKKLEQLEAILDQIADGQASGEE